MKFINNNILISHLCFFFKTIIYFFSATNCRDFVCAWKSLFLYLSWYLTWILFRLNLQDMISCGSYQIFDTNFFVAFIDRVFNILSFIEHFAFLLREDIIILNRPISEVIDEFNIHGENVIESTKWILKKHNFLPLIWHRSKCIRSV